MLFAPVWFSPDAKKPPHQKPGGGCNSCVWNVVRWGLDDNDYHHTFNNTLKAHLMSIVISTSSKKSSSLRALCQKTTLSVKVNLWYDPFPSSLPMITAKKLLWRSLRLSDTFRLPWHSLPCLNRSKGFLWSLAAFRRTSGTYPTPTPRICTQKIERQWDRTGVDEWISWLGELEP